jgi:sterol desaturase/sphingolipid hydroxylase (fatty acid hydroxylase superfamily)
MIDFFISTLFNLILYYFIATAVAFGLISMGDKFISIHKNVPVRKDYIREVKFSMLSLLIFTTIATILYQTKILDYTTLYYDVSEHGWLYYIGIIPVMLLMYDLYFYLTHRLMHDKRIFNVVHLVHHKSKYVSPLSALSMHPIEAIINHGYLVILLFLIPMHTSHVYIWVATTILYTTYLHLGIELYTDKFLSSKIGKYIYTATAHSEHHTKFKGNYGFYTLIWDKMFKTIRAKHA